MPSTKFVRQTLWLTAPVNLVAAFAFVFPDGWIGSLLKLPPNVPAFYAAMVGFLVALFGGMYAWMALQDEIDRSLLYIGAIGKCGVFVVAALVWASGQLQTFTLLGTSFDLVLGSIWFAWLRSPNTTAASAP